MGKEKLLPLAKTYFDHSKELVEIFGTEDHHFFYKEIQAQKYCNREGRLYFQIKRSDYSEIQTKKLSPKEVLQNTATSMGLEFDEKTTSADLKLMIEIKEEETK